MVVAAQPRRWCRAPDARRADADEAWHRHDCRNSHGKTTTTSLVASVLRRGRPDPTFVIGGRLLAAGSNARFGTGEFLVAEPDESDAPFLHLSPTLAVITNIDADHMETYGHSLSVCSRAFGRISPTDCRLRLALRLY